MAPLTSIERVLDPLRMRLLVEVARRGSISAAADACGIGQPSASTHLQTLEAALGRKLVERSGRASRLTPAGRLVAAHAGRLVATVEALYRALDAFDGGPDGDRAGRAGNGRDGAGNGRAKPGAAKPAA